MEDSTALQDAVWVCGRAADGATGAAGADPTIYSSEIAVFVVVK
jgi:hypothetical protein